jgi:hypothetical protein
MFISSSWQSKTALIVALGMSVGSVVPVLIAAQATIAVEPSIVGQTFPQSERVVVPAGSVIPVRLDKAEKLVVTPDETAPVTLLVAEDIRSSSGTILIPAGSRIEGEMRPISAGTQFVAKRLTLRNSNQRFPIDATSRVITERETIDKGTNVDAILKGAVIGGAAATVLSAIFDNVRIERVLGGAGAGALAGLLLGGRKKSEVVVIRPEADLALTLQSDLVLR